MKFKTILLTAHIKPVIGVTAITLLTSLLYGATAMQLLIIFCAAFAGQLSIGFSNNVFDATNDKKSGRKDKAIVNGDIAQAFIFRLALLFLAVSIGAILFLNTNAGLIFLSMLAVGWVYNIGLKNTPLSIVCYMTAFGFIPVFAAAVSGSKAYLLTVICFMFLGAVMHYADALGDYEYDNKAGIKGFTNVLPLSVGKNIFKLVVAIFFVLLVVNILTLA